MTQSKQRAQHVGRHMPREPELAVGRERSAGKGAGARTPTLKGSLSPPLGVQLNSLRSFLAHPLQRQGSVPRKQRGWGYGVLRLAWTAGLKDPPVGWPGHPPSLCQIRATRWQRGQGACGGGSVSLSLSASTMGGQRQAPNAASMGTMPGSH